MSSLDKSSKLSSLVLSSCVLLSSVLVKKHEHFISIFLSIVFLSMLVLVFYLKWWLNGFYALLARVYDKSAFIEARLDAQAPAPSDILRHVTAWFCQFDSKRGGNEIFKESLWRLKSSLLSAPWAKHYTAPQMAAEWNVFVAAAVQQAQVGVFYQRSLSKDINKEEDTDEWERILLITLRPELAELYDKHVSPQTLIPDSFALPYFKQIQSRAENLKRREGDSYSKIAGMPQAPRALPEWIR